MIKREMIKGLKAGRTLILDGWASHEDLAALAELDREGLTVAEWHETEQYSCWKVRWKKPPEPIGTFVEDASMAGE